MQEVAGLAVDAGTLARLRQQASHDPRQAARAAAVQFEAVFMQQMLASMRAAVVRSELLDSPGRSTWEGMLDAQLAREVSGRPGGLADLLARQLEQHLGLANADGAGTPASSDGAAAVSDGRGLRRYVPGFQPAGVGTVGSRSPAPAASPDGDARDIADSGAPRSAARAGATDDSGTRTAPFAGASASAPMQAAFVRGMYPHARAAQRETGVPAEFIVAQAALESGWGRAQIRHPDGQSAHNLFGIKAGANWRGRTVDVRTTEYVDGQPRSMVEKFRAYDSYGEAFADWARLMNGSSRYAQVLQAGASATGFAGGLQRAGYATDPHYAGKLERVIQRTLELRRPQI